MSNVVVMMRVVNLPFGRQLDVLEVEADAVRKRGDGAHVKLPNLRSRVPL